MLRNIRWGAILIALFAFYVAPLLLLVVITSVPNFFGVDPAQPQPLWLSPFLLVLAWFYAIAPVGAAYFAAKLARRLPLFHGLLVGIAGSAAVVLWVQEASPVSEVVLALLITSCGLFGGWLWRYRNERNNVAL